VGPLEEDVVKLRNPSIVAPQLVYLPTKLTELPLIADQAGEVTAIELVIQIVELAEVVDGARCQTLGSTGKQSLHGVPFVRRAYSYQADVGIRATGEL